jgi:hypothetical protein
LGTPLLALGRSGRAQPAIELGLGLDLLVPLALELALGGAHHPRGGLLLGRQHGLVGR